MVAGRKDDDRKDDGRKDDGLTPTAGYRPPGPPRVPANLHRYRSYDEDSSRWLSFPMRNDDIVISTRSKSGTTWVQMVCALLIFQTAALPDSLARLSPWLDWLVTPESEVFALLAAQGHRRFIKTHTPLDGIPTVPGVTYLVVGRHPLDMAVSMYHHRANLDRVRIGELVGRPPARTSSSAPSLDEWVGSWMGVDVDPREHLDTLPGVMWHLSGAWARRHEPGTVLVHYDDLLADLEGEMRRVAARLDVDVDEELWPDLVRAATFDDMRSRADRMVPDPSGILKDRTAFFRSGTSGDGRRLLGEDGLRRYQERADQLGPPDLLTWLHREAGPGP